ncbi:unnamed protein product [Arctia plantaginis]|uniref:THAP-type domain-containing protein n=1 Tax=Arctia plantaginis TaxID=874455 RepID=A0A8S1A458_ARCPL|nr:unnamed protein product [Arctia plantaginis]
MVGKICTVCRRCSYNNRHLSFFTYPSDPIRRYEWLEAVDRLDLLQKLNNHKTRGNHRICEIHFEGIYVKRSKLNEGRKCLSKDAFPTRCLAATAMYKKNAIWGNSTNQNTPIGKQIPTPSRYNLRPVKKEKKYIDDDDDQDSNIEEIVPYNYKSNRHTEVKTPPSPPYYVDPSLFCESVIKVSQSTQTPHKSILNINYQRKLEYPSEIKRLRAERATSGDETFIETNSQFLSPNLAKLIKWRLSSADSNEQVKLDLFALNLYYSTNLYNLLKDMLSLPSRESLKKFLLPKTTRLSEHFVNAFRCKINNMSNKERICSFSVGSILLKPNLYYNIKYDRIIGLHDIDGVQNIFLAKYAVLLMVHGILENWQQPVAYAFISEYDHSPEISIWIDEVLTTLINIGLDIRAFVSDPRSEFLYASETRFVSPEKSFFTINGTDIFYTYDTTQLLKIVKNNLKSCDFYYGPNLKISNNIEFFIKLSNLCNLLNSKLRSSNCQYKRAFSNKRYQKNFLNHMSQLFNNLKVVRKIDGVDVTDNMKFIEGFQITINSVLKLFEELNFLGVRYLLTCRLNHNRLHRFLAHIKQSNCKVECTPRQFNRSFVRSFVYNMLKKPMSINNTENTLDSEEFSQQLLDDEIQGVENVCNQPLLVHTTDYRELLPEKNAFVYFCKYCYMKCIEEHKCDSFQFYLDEFQQQKECVTHHCSVSLDLNVHNCKMSPPDDFTEFLMILENKFKEYFTPDVQINSVGQEILKNLEEYGFGMPCPCFPIDYLKALFVRVRLFYTIRRNNKFLKNRKSVRSLKVFSL